MSTPTETEQGSQHVAYRYKDEEGTLHIVDALDAVPDKYRAAAKRIVLAEGRKALDAVKARADDWPAVAKFVGELDAPSVAVGFAFGLLATFGLGVLKMTGKLILKLGLLIFIASLLFGAYFGWVRRSSTGDEKAILSGPRPLIEDANRAAEEVREHLGRQKDAVGD